MLHFSDDIFKEYPKFCGRCGLKLKTLEIRDKFDEYTGKPVFSLVGNCPSGQNFHDYMVELGPVETVV